jgi:hypothetical protein
MIRFRWLVALLVALTLPASAVWARQIALSTVALASPLGQETPDDPTDSPPPESLPDECADCCALHRFVQELLAKWALLWECGEYGQAEQLAAAAVAQCPHHIAAQHALVVSQIVNSGGMPATARWGCCIRGEVMGPGVGAIVCEEICFDVCRPKAAEAKSCCPAEKCVVKACCKDCPANCACGPKCACAKTAGTCTHDGCCTRHDDRRIQRTVAQHLQKLAEWYRLIEARGAERQAYAEAIEAHLKVFPAAKINMDLLQDQLRRLVIAQNKQHEAIAEYHKTIRRFQPIFLSGLTPAGTFTPDLQIPIGPAMMPVTVTEIVAVPMPPPAIIMHMGPHAMCVDGGCYTALPYPPAYAPVPLVCPPPAVCPPPIEVTRRMPGYPVQAQPPVCPVHHFDVVAAPPQATRVEHRPLHISADSTGVRIRGHRFDGRCDHVTLDENHTWIVLDGNVQIESRGESHARIKAQRARIHLKEGTITVDGPGRIETPPVPTEPVSRPTFSAPMPRPVPTTVPMPRPRRVLENGQMPERTPPSTGTRSSAPAQPSAEGFQFFLGLFR